MDLQADVLVGLDIRLGEAWSVALFVPSRQVGVYNI